MVNILLSNIKITFTVVIGFIVCNAVFNFLLRKTRLHIKKWNNSWIGKPKAVDTILRGIFFYGFLACLVTLQQMCNFINFGKEENYLSLVVGVLTLYGIFYAFIQFAINYASQNGRDKYWNRSKALILLSDNIEYKIFLSKTFKLMLLFSSVYPIINFKNQVLFNILPINPVKLTHYKCIAAAVWQVSLFCIYILYILLFFKSLLILLNFFAIQEKTDFSTVRKIKHSVISYYQTLFLYSYKEKDDFFYKELTKEINEIEIEEKGKLASLLLYNSFEKLIEEQEKKQMQIVKGKKIKEKVLDEYRYRCYYLINLFDDLWEYISNEGVKLNFKELLSFYQKQNEVLFNQINIFCLGKKIRIVKEINAFFVENRLLDDGNNTFFKIPKILWDKVTSYEKLIQLNNYIISREGTNELIQRIDNERITKRISKCCEGLIKGYKKYFSILLDKCREFEGNFVKDQYFSLFRTIRIAQDNVWIIYPGIQYQIFNYIYNLINNSECTDSNKRYLRILLNKIDYKFTLSFIFYIMLLPNGESLYKWHKDIMFLKEVNDDFYYKYVDNINTEENVNCICSIIKDSNIGHKVSLELVRWIIHNLNSKVTRDLIQKCIKYSYISYAKLLKFKYIFQSDRYSRFYLDYSEINLTDLNTDKWNDWRIDFLHEMLETPNLFDEDFFSSHQYAFYEEVFNASIPQQIFITNDFRFFNVNRFFTLSEEKFMDIINSEFYMIIGKGIIDFLILKLDDEQYNYLILNEKISYEFIKKVKVIIERNSFSVSDYVDNLVAKANECYKNDISPFKKKLIIMKLQKQIYGESNRLLIE